MMKSINLLLYALVAITITISSCNKEQIAEPIGGECLFSCGQGIVDCINGYCLCPEGSRKIARGFCINQEMGFNYEFVTYDQVPNIIDTMVVSFQEEPYDIEWQNGDNIFKTVPTYSYNRNVGLENPGGSNATFKYSGNPQSHVDEVTLWTIYGGGNKSMITRGRFQCLYYFRGSFTDRNTIEGDIIVDICRELREGESPRSPDLPNVGDRFPVTFTRVP